MESAYCDGCGVNEVHYQDDYGQVALVLCAECNGGHATAGGHDGAVPTFQDEKDVTHEHEVALLCRDEAAQLGIEYLGVWGPEVNRQHWAKSGIVAFSEKDKANAFYKAAAKKYGAASITTWKMDDLYIVCLSKRRRNQKSAV